MQRKGSLTTRLTLVGTTATALVLLVVLFGGLFVFSRQLNSAVDDSLRERADDLQSAIAQGGPTAVRQEGLAQLYDRDGSVLASSGTVKAGIPLLTGGSKVSCPGPDALFATSTRLAAGGGKQPLHLLARCLPDGQVLTVAVSVEQQDAANDRLLKVIALIAPILLAGVALTLWRTVRGALRPVDDLTRQAQQIDAGDAPSLVVPVTGREDEISRLGRTLQEMLVRLDVAFLREQAFVDDAAHELRTPLAVLRGELELALSDLDDSAGVRVSLRAALAETERLGRLAEDLLALARQRTAGAPDQQELRLRMFLDLFAERMAVVFHVEVSVSCAEDLVVKTSPDRVDRVLTNLVANAADAHAHRVGLVAARTANQISLLVEDDGPGFPEAFLPTAFERFARADRARSRTTGAGLGLALVQSLVHGLGGTVTLDNRSTLGGAAVRLLLPVSPPSHLG